MISPTLAARELADRTRLVFEGSYQAGSLNLRKLASALEAKLRRGFGFSDDLKAAVILNHQQGSLFGRPSTIYNFTGGSETRFALAHEMAHVLSSYFEYPGNQPQWSDKDWARFFDECASHLLLSDEILSHLFNGEVSLSINGLLSATKQAKVSVSLLLTRLDMAAQEGALHLRNGALVVLTSLSARGRRDYSPRVQSRCGNVQWYVPLNKRLKTLGASNLESFFISGQVDHDVDISDRLLLWNRKKHKTESVDAEFHARMFETSTASKRALIATMLLHPNDQL